MQRFNTYSLYKLAIEIHELMAIPAVEHDLMNSLWVIWQATFTLQRHFGPYGILPPSSRRAAQTLYEEIRKVVDVESKDIASEITGKKLAVYQIHAIKDAVKNFEVVVANDLPGLDTYLVSQKGIYSTPELTERAENALLESLPEDCRSFINEQERKDFQQAGRCLSFELPTASGFHALRATESIIKRYWRLALKKADTDDCPALGVCIANLREKKEDPKVLDILDHVRDLSRNPVMHPNVFLEMHDAFRTFDIAKSAICNVAMRLKELSPQLDLLNSEKPELVALPQPSDADNNITD